MSVPRTHPPTRPLCINSRRPQVIGHYSHYKPIKKVSEKCTHDPMQVMPGGMAGIWARGQEPGTKSTQPRERERAPGCPTLTAAAAECASLCSHRPWFCCWAEAEAEALGPEWAVVWWVAPPEGRTPPLRNGTGQIIMTIIITWTRSIDKQTFRWLRSHKSTANKQSSEKFQRRTDSRSAYSALYKQHWRRRRPLAPPAYCLLSLLPHQPLSMPE